MSAVEQEGKEKSARSTVLPVLPLAVLESVRTHDRPRELLMDEDLAASLPRRLGLTGVIDSQIRRYDEAVRRGRRVPADEFLDLLRLVLRRPDAAGILREAGQRIARHFASLPPGAVLALRVLPARARFAAVRRSAARLLRRMTDPAEVTVTGTPLVVRIPAAVTVQADATGTACVLFTAALEELAHRYTGAPATIQHTRCAARGDECCEWSLVP